MLYVLVPVGLQSTTTTTDTYCLHRTQASPVPSYRCCCTRIIPSTTSSSAICVLYAIPGTIYSTAASPACMYCCTYCMYWCTCCTDVQRILFVLLCEKKLPVRHPSLAPSLRAPVRTAAVYVPGLTYAEVHPTSILVSGCCPVYVPGVLRAAAGIGTVVSLSC